MTENINNQAIKKYSAKDIYVYVFREKVFPTAKGFHIIIDNGDQHYVDLVTKDGLRMINRCQLETPELKSFSYTNLLEIYNSICEAHKLDDILIPITDEYEESELLDADMKLESEFAGVTPTMMAESSTIERLESKKVKQKSKNML